MQAYCKGGLLDKLLSTPVGGTLEITPEETHGLLAALASAPNVRGTVEISMDLTRTGKSILMGRNICIGPYGKGC